MTQTLGSPGSPDSPGSPPVAPAARSSRGVWVVVVLIVAAVVVAIVVRGWWRMQADYQREQAAAEGAGSVPFDAAEAQADADLVGQNFHDAIINHTSIEPVREAARRLVEKYPRFAPAYLTYGQVLHRQGRFQDAYDHYARSLEINPQQSDLHVIAGVLAEELDDMSGAVGHYDKAASLDPAQPLHRVRLANAYSQMQRYDDARDVLLKAIRADSSLHEAYYLLASVYAKQNKLTLAMPQIQKAIDNVPVNKRMTMVIYMRMKASLLRRDNRPDEALLTLDALLPQERADPRVIEEMALSWSMVEDYERAAQVYEDAMVGEWPNPDLIAGAARWRIKAGGHNAARRHIATLQRINPRHPAIDELLEQINE